MFYREGLLAPRPTPKLEDHPLSAVHDCLFNLFAAALHKGGRSSIRNLRTRHAVVTGTHYTARGKVIDHKMCVLNFEVRHPRCVGSITKNFLCVTHTVEHNYISPSSTVLVVFLLYY